MPSSYSARVQAERKGRLPVGFSGHGGRQCEATPAGLQCRCWRSADSCYDYEWPRELHARGIRIGDWRRLRESADGAGSPDYPHLNTEMMEFWAPGSNCVRVARHTPEVESFLYRRAGSMLPWTHRCQALLVGARAAGQPGAFGTNNFWIQGWRTANAIPVVFC